MKSLLTLLLLVGIVFFIIKYYKYQGKLIDFLVNLSGKISKGCQTVNEKFYESYNPIDTRDFSFEQAVEGCCFAVTEFLKLEEEFLKIDGVLKAKGENLNKLPNPYYKDPDYEPNLSYPESEENKLYRKYHKEKILTPIPIIWPPRRIREKVKLFPWHFNPHPVGSPIYLLRNQCNAISDKMHHLYYDLYLPCKNKADELICEPKNREGEYFNVYIEIGAYKSAMYNRTPMQRIFREKDRQRLDDFKITAAVAGIVTVGTVAAFSSMLHKAGKGMFQSTQGGTKFRNIETGEEFDYDPRY